MGTHTCGNHWENGLMTTGVGRHASDFYLFTITRYDTSYTIMFDCTVKVAYYNFERIHMAAQGSDLINSASSP